MVLSLFRLFQPISMKSFYELIPDQSHILDLRLKKFQESGFCEFSNGIFQWKPEAVLFLDSKILELTSY
ncbi:hypothetical protein LEP1GSC170_3657 [Leptospira interrogans serovar Bataviae str. HAI135]|nr:hypothetical protein LEP1GSC170_3657 [Leptospira interrogans serovar Bataviae str. HAI135]